MPLRGKIAEDRMRGVSREMLVVCRLQFGSAGHAFREVPVL
jgi:hypothetical protein